MSVAQPSPRKGKGGLRKQSKVPSTDGLYLTLEAAERLLGGNVSLSTIRHWVYTGRLKVSKPGKCVLVKRSDLIDFIDSAVHKSSAMIKDEAGA
jgi:excisionase family DNA binding protein